MQPSGRGTVACALHDAEVVAPRADGLAKGTRQSARKLMKMREVVRCPGGEQLGECDGAEGGVTAEAIEVTRLEVEVGEIAETDGARMGELIKELREGFAVSFADVAQAIKTRKGLGLAVLEDVARARQPVRAFAVNEVAEDVMRVPGVRALVGEGEGFRKFAEECRERGRCTAEQSERVVQAWFHG
jgi:hypothetical protein